MDDERFEVSIRATGFVRLSPPRVSSSTPPVLVAIHGYGQPPEQMLAFARSVASDEAVVIAPEGPSTFYRRARTPGGAAKGGIGCGWVADPNREATDRRNDALIDAALEQVAAQYETRPETTYLLGYSQGVGVACHFLALHPDRAAGVVGLAGGIPATFRPTLSSCRDKPVYWVTGTRDASYPPAYTSEVEAAWREAGALLETLHLDEGHDLLERASSPVRAWLRARLAE